MGDRVGLRNEERRTGETIYVLFRVGCPNSSDAYIGRRRGNEDAATERDEQTNDESQKGTHV